MSKSKRGEIKVSSKTLGLISSGIYRTTASALKELVSNAFDADADWVRIAFNPPAFDVVSITDNGSGMTFGKFVSLMERQIGDSDKRAHGDRSATKKRPIIGRIGIGLLAIAQVCHSFELVSHHRESRTAFRARIELLDYIPERLDEETPAKPKYDVGTYEAEVIDFDEKQVGTRIIATELKSGLVKRLRQDTTTETPDAPRMTGEQARQEHPTRLPLRFDDFFREVVRHDSIRSMSEYWQTVWGIALSVPLPYYNGGPVRNTDTTIDQNHQLKDYNFAVYADGLRLLRPVVLPPRLSDQRPSSNLKVTRLAINQEIEGTRLRGEGYIYSQGGKSIYPADLRGMLIRIKNVAIGTYDKNFLEYPVNEGPRLSWLSGEINIDEGLEDALNIDRDSFNENHPHYMALQQLVHSTLDREVRPWLYRNLDERKEIRERQAGVDRDNRLLQVASRFLPNARQVEHVRVLPGGDSNSAQDAHVFIDDSQGLIQINEAATWPHNKRERETAERVAVAFELALNATSTEEMRQRFYEILNVILG